MARYILNGRIIESNYFPQNAIKLHYSTPTMNIEDSRRLVTKQDMAEKLWAVNNLPSEYHPSVFDKGPYLRDETWMQFVRWKMGCEKDHTIEYVETTPTERFMIPSGAEPVFYNIGGLIAADASGKFNFRDAGKLYYKAYLLREHFKDLITSDVGEELAIQKGDLLSKAPDIEYIMIEKGKEGIYGMLQICEHSAILSGNWDSYKKIEALARREGMNVDDMILRGMLEEGGHLIRRDKATIQNEIDVRLMMIDIYGALAEKALDPKVKEKYQKMVSHLERSLSEVKETYSKIYSKNVNIHVKMYISDSSKLELILEAEARLEYGLTDDREVKEYVESRLEEIAEGAENEYSGKDGVAEEGADAEMVAEYAGDAESVDGECAEAEACAAECGDCVEGD